MSDDINPEKLKVIELRAELQKRGLDTKGVKSVLVERLVAALHSESNEVDDGSKPSINLENLDATYESDTSSTQEAPSTRRSARSPTKSPRSPAKTLTKAARLPSEAAVSEFAHNGQNDVKEISVEVPIVAEVKETSADPAASPESSPVKSESFSSPAKAAVSDVTSSEADEVPDLKADTVLPCCEADEPMIVGEVEVRKRARSKSPSPEPKRARSKSPEDVIVLAGEGEATVEIKEAEVIVEEKKEPEEKKPPPPPPKRRSPSPCLKEYELQKAVPEVEEPEFDSNVFLDSYNSDLNFCLDSNRLGGCPLTKAGFAMMWGGIRTTHGFTNSALKIVYEVKVTEQVYVRSENYNLYDETLNSIRVGFSTNANGLQLGEEAYSYGYDSAMGKKVTGNVFEDYGEATTEDVVISAFLNLSVDPVEMSFAKDGVHQGVAFTLSREELAEHALYPHILSKSSRFRINLGQLETPFFSNPEGYEDFIFPQKVEAEHRVRGTTAPRKIEDCEVIMMCGLPGSGKTTWVAKHITENPEKYYDVIGSANVIARMSVQGHMRQYTLQTQEQLTELLYKAESCTNTLVTVASRRKRNYIIDQVNANPERRAKKITQFEKFQRKAVVVVPSDEEFKRRWEEKMKAEGKIEVPVVEAAVAEGEGEKYDAVAVEEESPSEKKTQTQGEEKAEGAAEGDKAEPDVSEDEVVTSKKIVDSATEKVDEATADKVEEAVKSVVDEPKSDVENATENGSAASDEVEASESNETMMKTNEEKPAETTEEIKPTEDTCAPSVDSSNTPALTSTTVESEEPKAIPISADDKMLIEWKDAFVLPEVGDLFHEVLFVELQLDEAAELVATYRTQAAEELVRLQEEARKEREARQSRWGNQSRRWEGRQDGSGWRGGRSGGDYQKSWGGGSYNNRGGGGYNRGGGGGGYRDRNQGGGGWGSGGGNRGSSQGGWRGMGGGGGGGYQNRDRGYGGGGGGNRWGSGGGGSGGNRWGDNRGGNGGATGGNRYGGGGSDYKSGGGSGNRGYGGGSRDGGGYGGGRDGGGSYNRDRSAGGSSTGGGNRWGNNGGTGGSGGSYNRQGSAAVGGRGSRDSSSGGSSGRSHTGSYGSSGYGSGNQSQPWSNYYGSYNQSGTGAGAGGYGQGQNWANYYGQQGGTGAGGVAPTTASNAWAGWGPAAAAGAGGYTAAAANYYGQQAYQYANYYNQYAGYTTPGTAAPYTTATTGYTNTPTTK